MVAILNSLLDGRIPTVLVSVSAAMPLQLHSNMPPRAANTTAAIVREISVDSPTPFKSDAAYRKAMLKHASFVGENGVFLVFADGYSGNWSFESLGLFMDHMKAPTIKASMTGEAMEMASIWNDTVEIDASALRASADPEYADFIDAEVRNLIPPDNSLNAATRIHKPSA